MNHKGWLLQVAGLTLVALLSGACATSQPIPTATAVPPTAMPAPPTATLSPVIAPAVPTVPVGGNSSAAIPTPGADWLTYTNSGYGFQLLYPPGSSLVPTGTVSFTGITLPVAGGTNLVGKKLGIYVQVGSPTCQSPMNGFTNPAATRANIAINGLNWVNQALGGAPIGASSDWTSYSTDSGGVCVSLGFTVSFQNPPSGTGGPPAYNKAAESQSFLQIVNTFKWLSGGAVTPTP